MLQPGLVGISFAGADICGESRCEACEQKAYLAAMLQYGLMGKGMMAMPPMPTGDCFIFL